VANVRQPPTRAQLKQVQAAVQAHYRRLYLLFTNPHQVSRDAAAVGPPTSPGHPPVDQRVLHQPWTCLPSRVSITAHQLRFRPQGWRTQRAPVNLARQRPLLQLANTDLEVRTAG
jgi:hypothetical protein